MELHGVDLLEWWLTKWLAEHGFEEVKAKVNPQFEYFTTGTTIGFALVANPVVDKHFLEFAQERHDFPYDCDNFLISFFHELGHYMTEDNWDWDEWEDYRKTVKLIMSRIDDLYTCHECYFNLPQEWEATEWACRYICDHAEEIQKFWQTCQKLLINIYKLNNIEMEEI